MGWQESCTSAGHCRRERRVPLKAVTAVRIRSGLQTFHLANRAGAGSPPGGCFTLGPGPAGSAGELDPVEPRWQAAEMRTYGQYCPIARTSELLAERWTIIILRNVLVGCQTFNEIADGAPGLSRRAALQAAAGARARWDHPDPSQARRPRLDLRTHPGRPGAVSADAGPRALGSEVGGAQARTRPSRRGAVGVGELLPRPRPAPSAPGSGPLRVPHAAGVRPPEMVADRTRRRRVLPEGTRRPSPPAPTPRPRATGTSTRPSSGGSRRRSPASTHRGGTTTTHRARRINAPTLAASTPSRTTSACTSGPGSA